MMLAVVPLPGDQEYEVPPEATSVAEFPVHSAWSGPALATGSAFTVTGCVTVSVHPFDDVAIIVTLKVPEVAYVCEGLVELDVERSPKLHVKLVIPPVEITDVFVKLVATPMQTVLFVNDAVGNG